MSKKQGIKFSKEYSSLLSEKAMDLANMSLVGIVLSQFISTEPFKGNVAFLGTIAFLVLHTGAYFLMKGGGRN